MWYVIQVMGGKEEETVDFIHRQISSELLEECFIPKKERVKKFRGEWRQVEEILFPGYVFAVTEDPEELYLRLKSVPRLTKLLQDGVFTFLPLSEEEEEMIRTIGDNYHVTRLSRVYVDTADTDEAVAAAMSDGSKTDRTIVILDGPLKAQEGRILKYNLHKREVTVRIPFAGTMVDLKLGIEMVGVKNE